MVLLKQKKSKIIKNKKDITSSIVKIISHGYILDLTIPSQIEKEISSIGSGFFIDNKGTIITCAHVVENARSIICKFKNGQDREYEATVVKICFDNDIALLRIKDTSFKTSNFLKLGSLNMLNQGDKVFAYGFPLGTTISNIQMTDGIISGRDRYLIQTDTAINPGNSGGPLLFKNKVVGINSLKMVGDYVDNIGFATPIDLIKTLNTEGDEVLVRRPEIGVSFYPLNRVGLEYLKSECKSGIYVYEVMDYSPLKGIIKKGDVLCSFNDIKINNKGYLDLKIFDEPISLNDYLNFIENNTELKVSFWDGNKISKKKFILQYKSHPLENVYPMYQEVEYEVIGGMVFMELAAEHLIIFPELIFNNGPNIQKKKYVILTKVFPHSIAYKDKNMAPGKIIAKVNNKEIHSLKQFTHAINNPIKNKSSPNICIFEMNQGEIAVFNQNDLNGQQNNTYFPTQKLKY